MVHLPHAFALLKGKITCGRCTFTPVSGVEAQLPKPPSLETTLLRHSKYECTTVAAIPLRMRMRMRILTRPENSLANVSPPNLKEKAAN